MINRYLLMFVLLWTFACDSNQQDADLIVHNAVIWTGDDNNPKATTLVVDDGIILAVGEPELISQYEGANTTIIDVNGKFITPGFIDTHVHFITGGQNLSSVQLRDASTQAEFINRIADFAKAIEPGTWIIGGDWDHKLWGGELPQKEWVDSVTSENPILLNRLDGHMALTNSLGLEAFNISATTPSVEGGNIVKNEEDEPTGLLEENAFYNQMEYVPEFSDAQNEAFATAAMKYVASHGVTSVHDMNGFTDMAVFERLHSKGALITRIYSNTPLPDWQQLKEKIDATGSGDSWLKIGGLKGFVDGSLGSHTAAFFEGFTDEPKEHGYFVNSRDDLYSWIKGADEANLQVMVHAIGDSANSTILDIYEQVEQENGPRDRRFRVEHAQHLTNDDINRFVELGVIPVMQPYHAIDDGRWALDVIGPERIKTTYAFKSLLDANAKLAFGSDWFVAPPIPLLGIYAAITRRTLDDQNPDGWVPEQKITVEEALIAYTINGAYASFEEDIKGSLEVGKLADFVVFDRNLLEIDPVIIKNAMVLMTFVGGKQVYVAEQL